MRAQKEHCLPEERERRAEEKRQRAEEGRRRAENIRHLVEERLKQMLIQKSGEKRSCF